MESQQRLLTIRSQMEKLQAQENLVLETIRGLENIKMALETGPEPEDHLQTFIKVVDAQEEERERLARAMHDGPAHSLTNFILQAEICQKLFDRDTDKARAELDNLQDSAREAFQRVRDFIFDLRPMMLTDLGLVPTVKRYLDAYETKTNIETQLNIQGRERRLEGYREVLMFRGIQELLVNVRDHAQASEVKVDIDMGDEFITALVEDNGRGFETGKLTLDGSSESGAIGLSTLQNRLNLIGGSIQLDSVTGQGARIEISIPAGLEQGEDLNNLS
jgi:two-component system sensor histidine kinase DegS